MTRLTFTIEILESPGHVWAFFVPQRMPYWYGAEMEAEFEVQGGASDFAVGQKVRIIGRVLRCEVALTAVITRCEPRRVLEWKFRDKYGIRGTQRWEIAPAVPASDGEVRRARVTLHEEFELPEKGRLARLAERFWMRPSVARRDRLHLAKLKQLAERA